MLHELFLVAIPAHFPYETQRTDPQTVAKPGSYDQQLNRRGELIIYASLTQLCLVVKLSVQTLEL